MATRWSEKGPWVLRPGAFKERLTFSATLAIGRWRGGGCHYEGGEGGWGGGEEGEGGEDEVEGRRVDWIWVAASIVLFGLVEVLDKEVC